MTIPKICGLAFDVDKWTTTYFGGPMGYLFLSIYFQSVDLPVQHVPPPQCHRTTTNWSVKFLFYKMKNRQLISLFP